jgi:hypothetical protein
MLNIQQLNPPVITQMMNIPHRAKFMHPHQREPPFFTDNSASQSALVVQSPPLSHVQSQSDDRHDNRNTSPRPPPISYSDHYPRQPYNPISSRYFDCVVQPIDPEDLMNPAEFSNSSIVQGGNLFNVAVEHHAPAPDRDVPEEYSTNAATITQTAIVIDEDDASSRGHYVQLYQCHIIEQDNAQEH